ncbi:hypothetical protein [Vibrio harveyi]|uniref:hypothetical protein n=1 Tax=Vibrio harveyi TaxID=669 RepID=UPI00165E78DC|nr:hypothetical protein [Vibrio harveyi]
MGAGPHGGSRANGGGSRNSNRGSGSHSDNNHSSEHSSFNRGGSLPSGFGGTDNVDGTSTPGRGETQSSQNGGNGNWSSDNNLNGGSDLGSSSFDHLGLDMAGVDPSASLGLNGFEGLGIDRYHADTNGNVGNTHAPFFGSQTDADMLGEMQHNPYDPTLSQEAYKTDLVRDVLADLTPFGLGGYAYDAVQAFGDFVSPPTREQLVARDYFAQNAPNAAWHDAYTAGGRALGAVATVAPYSGVAANVVRNVAPVYTGGVSAVVDAANNMQKMSAQQGLAASSAYARAHPEFSNTRAPERGDIGGRGGAQERSTFAGGVPSPGQQIAETRPLNPVSSSGISKANFSSMPSNQEQVSAPMQTSTFAPISGSVGYDIASTTPVTTQAEHSGQNLALLNQNLLDPGEFSTPQNLFNPGQVEDDFYKTLNRQSLLWNGG